MSSVPTAERPPEGLSAYWLGVWRHALKVLKEQGTWAWEQRPLLDEYVFALREARVSRELAEVDPYHPTTAGSLQPHPGFVQADRAARRAVLLAGTLKLTPEEQRKLVATDGSAAADPFAEFDELAQARARRSGT